MRRLRKIILLLPFLVIILIGVVALRRLGPPPEQIRLLAQSELSRVLDRPVSIGRVSRGLLTKAVLHDLRIGRPGQAEGEPLVVAPSVAVHYRLGDLVAGKTDAVGSISRIVVNRPRVVVERSAQGVWSIADLIERPRPAEPSKFRGRIVIRSGQVTFTDRAAPGGRAVFRVGGLHGDIDFGRPPQVQVALSCRADDGRFRRLRVVAGYDTADRSFEGSLNVASLTAATLDRYLPRLIPVRLTSGTLDAQVLAAVAMGGKADWSAEVALNRIGARIPLLQQRAVISGRVRVTDDVVRLENVRVESDAARLRVSGTVAGLAEPQLDLAAEVTIERPLLVVPAATRPTLGKWLTLGGPLTARVRVLGPARKPALAGRIALASVTASGIRLEQPTADISYREGQVWLDNVQTRVAGGRVTGKGWAALGDGGLSAVARAEVMGVRAEEITRALKTEPVSGRISGEAAVNVSRGRPDLVARLSLVAGSVRGLPFERGRFLARWADGALTLNEASVETTYGRLLANGSVGPHEFDLNVSLSDVNLAAAGVVVGRADLAGTASARGTLTGPLTSPKFEGSLRASDVRVAGYQADALEARLSATRREIELTTGTVYRGGGRIIVSGKIAGPDFGKAEISGRVQVRSADLAELYAPEGREPPLQGLLNATLDVEGRLPNPRASGTVEVGGLEAAGIGLGSARAEIAYSDGIITVERGTLDVNGSQVRLAGTVATRPAPGEMDLTVTAESLNLSPLRLERFVGAEVKLGGRVNLEAHVTGSPERPTVSASINDSQVALNGMRLRDLAAAGAWSKERLQLERVRFSLGKGTYTVRGAVETRDGALDLTFDVRDGDLAALRAAAPALGALPGEASRVAKALMAVPAPFSGVLNAQGQIAGGPAQRRGGVAFKADDVVIGGKPVPSVSGSVTFAGTRLTVERFVAKAEEAYATAQGTVDLAGEMHLDVDAYNISAQTIQSVARVKQPLSGTANVSMVVTGPTHSPHVVATATLSDAKIGPLALGEVLVSRIEIADGTISVDRVTLAPRGRQLSAGGKVAFSWTKPHLPPDGLLDVSIDLGRQDLDLLAALLPGLVSEAQGPVKGALHVGGTWAQPRYDGQMRVKGEEIAIGDFAEMDLDASLRLTTQDGNTPRPVISGRIALRAVFGIPSVEIAPAGPAKRLPTVLDPRLDLEVVVEEGTRLETAAVGMWLTGQGRIGGTVSAPTVSVSMESRRGFLQLPAGRFRLVYAAVDLVRPAPSAAQPAPRLRLPLTADYEGEATRYEVGGPGRRYSITMRVSGDLLDPDRPLDVELHSVPDLPEAEVYAMVTGMGGVLGALREGAASALLASQMRDLFTAGYATSQLHPIEQRIARALRLEDFGIDITSLAGGRPLRVRLGKALSDRLYATYSRAVSGDQAGRLRVTFQLTPTWSLGWIYESAELETLDAPTALREQRPRTRIEVRKAFRF